MSRGAVLSETKIVLVGQTPPPFGGQALMIQTILEGSYEGFSLRHVRMAFSKDFGEVGRFRPKKLLHLVSVIGRIAWTRVRWGGDILYYPPAQAKVAMYRDILILLSTRWMFRATVFHFHAAGLAVTYEALPSVVKTLFRKALFAPEVGIRLSARNDDDSTTLGAKRDLVVPNGIPDAGAAVAPARRRAGNILNVGLLSAAKGIPDLLDAAALLKGRGVPFSLTLVGQFDSPRFEVEVRGFVEEHGLRDEVEIRGELVGMEKHAAYREAAVFCFPTKAPSESFGIVLLEAMQHHLPIVASAWKAIPDLVRDGEYGFLFPPGDVVTLADRLERLLTDDRLRTSFGERGRAEYERRFTADAFRRGMMSAFEAAAKEMNSP